jgi:hypothetical protein
MQMTLMGLWYGSHVHSDWHPYQLPIVRLEDHKTGADGGTLGTSPPGRDHILIWYVHLGRPFSASCLRLGVGWRPQGITYPGRKLGTKIAESNNDDNRVVAS